jgi:two-component system sensor histidine kinase DegS
VRLSERLENLVRDRQQHYPSIIRTDLGPSIILVAHRVVQEGLMNALRHAQPTHVEIHLESGADQITVTAQDDGVGLLDDWARAGHFGLCALPDRIQRLSGKLTVARRDEFSQGGRFPGAPQRTCLGAQIRLMVNV